MYFAIVIASQTYKYLLKKTRGMRQPPPTCSRLSLKAQGIKRGMCKTMCLNLAALSATFDHVQLL